MNEKEDCNSKKKKENQRKIEVSQNKSGINLFIQPQSWLYDVKEFNKRAQKSDNHLDILPLH